jgi:hypothetical protein
LGQVQDFSRETDPCKDNFSMPAFDDKPRKMFFMEEYITGNWRKFLDPSSFNPYILNNHSPAIDHLMNSFQH